MHHVETHPLLSSLPFNFKEKGFAKLDFSFTRKQALQIFSHLDKVCLLVKNEYDESFASLDEIISAFIASSKTPVANESLQLKKIKNEFMDYEIHSYQYLEGLYEYVTENAVGKKVKKDALEFLRLMRDNHRLIKDYLKDVIQTIEEQVKCTTMFKVWRYTPVEGKNYLVPLHYDRAIFTSIVHTMNPGKECLRLGPPGQGENIEEVRKTADLNSYHQPSEIDFPLIFPGMHAKYYFGLNPTAHAVTTVEKGNASKDRYSLVFFIVPHESLSLNENYIAAEN
jgi:hypothetical protein